MWRYIPVTVIWFGAIKTAMYLLIHQVIGIGLFQIQLEMAWQNLFALLTILKQIQIITINNKENL